MKDQTRNTARHMPARRLSRVSHNSQQGFTLVEMLVAITLFAVVMLVSVGALLALVDANRKAQALQSVMNNLNVALDGIVRSARMGSDYHCGAGGALSVPQNCPGGGTTFAFEAFGGNSETVADQWVYRFDSERIYKSENGGGTWFAVTAPEVEINDMRFYVTGTDRLQTGDMSQPQVVIVIRGTAGSDRARTSTTFSIQATAAQRIIDI
jgi:prepilin-type N-terminal cleavage/methylation domain-containing protein